MFWLRTVQAAAGGSCSGSRAGGRGREWGVQGVQDQQEEQSGGARSSPMSARRLARLEARLRRLRTAAGAPAEWTAADWQLLAEDGLAAAAEIRHQRWLVQQWRMLAQPEKA